MPPQPLPLLSRPARDGARVVALEWLAHVRDAAARLRDTPTDADALHDVRVALTRLRATLRLYGAELGKGLGRRGTQQLQHLHRTLGIARDLDVQRGWLESERQGMPSEATEGVDWLLARIAKQRAVQTPRIDRALTRRFDRHADAWQQALSHYTVEHTVQHVAVCTSDKSVTDPPFAAAVVQQLHHASQRLRAAIERAVRDAETEDTPGFASLHRVRLHLKRLRALLAPWQHADPELPTLPSALQPLLTSLAGAQETLGRMHDAQVLARHARSAAGSRATPSLDAIAAYADDVAHDHALAFLHGWLGEPGTVAFPEVAEAAEALARIARAGHEIERKFLLREAPALALAAPGVRIAQGWLPGERLRERLRRSVHPGGEVTWTRTVKLGTGVSRIELEESADAMLFESLWPLTASARVDKVRHTVVDGAFTWEIDVFLDRPLVLAEVELPSADTRVAFPDWLAPCVDRDVTGDAAFVNANLARDTRRSNGAP